ncbi:hypothetical protein ADIS_0345 [Lunatimonas lonarensis]|uniref:Uncharacterized protein n=1 Tax=Lunatimonas lonarensis TaxID=1232681 RepID=R7ZYE1_9BACT|nr:hypothetical protein ADIS_0345 [Lunatimonas lonarensis]
MDDMLDRIRLKIGRKSIFSTSIYLTTFPKTNHTPLISS